MDKNVVSNTNVAIDAIKVATKSGDWDGVHHLYKVVSVAQRWDATTRGILHDALEPTGLLG